MSKYAIVDAHLHLWEQQNGLLNGRPVVGLGNGLSDFGGEVHQMMPPYMVDNKNTIDRLIANMNYACVNGCVVTQEYIDGNQDAYLLSARSEYPDRVKICALYEDYGAGLSAFTPQYLAQFDGVKVCASRLQDKDLTKLLPLFQRIEEAGRFLSIDLCDGAMQVPAMQEIIRSCPDLRIAIGHFGMVTTDGWQKQIELACNKNVCIESGGLTWLFHKEFYPYPSAIAAICEARDICGIDKLMWGSDYPRTMTDLSYINAIRFIKETPRLTDAEKAAFLGGNAIRFYGFRDFTPLPDVLNML